MNSSVTILLILFFVFCFLLASTIDLTTERQATASMYLPYKKSTIFEEPSPNISYTAFTPTASLFNSDVKIHSTLELSSSQKCNQLLPSMEYPSLSHSAYFTKNSPKIVTTVSETYLPLEPSGSMFSISTNSSKTLSTRQEMSALSHGSFENHFLWNTSLFCSQNSLNPGKPTNTIIDDIFNSEFEKSSTDLRKNMSSNSNDDETSIKHNNHSKILSTSFYKATLNEGLNSNCSTMKRNPYSIEEILKKPDKKTDHSENIVFNYQKNDNEQKVSKLGGVESSLHKRSRIRLKIYDMTV